MTSYETGWSFDDTNKTWRPPSPTAHTHDTSAQAALASPAGMVAPFAGATAPSGWLLCDGSSYSTTAYPNLFTVIGYTYGGAAGTFDVPDLRGRTVLGVGTGTGGGASGTGAPAGGAALTARALSAWAGEETHVLVTGELASHGHTQDSHSHSHNHNAFNAATGGMGANENHSHTHAKVRTTNTSHAHDSDAAEVSVNATGTGTGFGTDITVSTANLAHGHVFNHTHDTNATTATATNQTAGSGTAHNNVQPFVALNYIIRAA